MRRRTPAACLASAAAVAALAGCSTFGVDESVGYAEGSGDLVTIVEPADREPAPVLEGVDLEGDPLSTADYEGEVLVVNLWGAWCAPCRAETPALIEAAERLEGTARIIGLTTRGNVVDDRSYVDDEGIPYPSIQDYDGTQQLKFADSLPANAIPTTWVIDSQGRVAARIMDEVTAATLVGLVEDVEAD